MTTILVVRKFDNFSRILREKNFEVINCPTIETVETAHDLAAKISAKNYDGVFLTSRNAAEIADREVFCKNFRYGGKVYVLGKSSYELLKNRNLDLFFDQSANTAREMLAAIPPADLKGRRFLFIRGEKSLATIPEYLENIAELDEIVVYETRQIAVEDSLKKELEAKLKTGQITFACFFSPSGAESFCEQFGAQSLHQTNIATIGKTTADFFAKRNLQINFTPAKATAEDFANELVEHLKNILPAEDAEGTERK